MKSDLIMRVHVYVFLKTLKCANDWSIKFNDVYILRYSLKAHTHILHHCNINSNMYHLWYLLSSVVTLSLLPYLDNSSNDGRGIINKFYPFTSCLAISDIAGHITIAYLAGPPINSYYSARSWHCQGMQDNFSFLFLMGTGCFNNEWVWPC